MIQLMAALWNEEILLYSTLVLYSNFKYIVCRVRSQRKIRKGLGSRDQGGRSEICEWSGEHLSSESEETMANPSIDKTRISLVYRAHRQGRARRR